MKCCKCNKLIIIVESDETNAIVDRYLFEKHGKCYKCIYEEKNVLKVRSCQMCREILPKNRWKYCSDECAEEGNKINKKDYWVNTMKSQEMTWHKYSNYKNIFKYENLRRNRIVDHQIDSNFIP